MINEKAFQAAMFAYRNEENAAKAVRAAIVAYELAGAPQGDENAAAQLVQNWIRDNSPSWVVTISEAQDLVSQLCHYLRLTKPVSEKQKKAYQVINVFYDCDNDFVIHGCEYTDSLPPSICRYRDEFQKLYPQYELRGNYGSLESAIKQESV